MIETLTEIFSEADEFYPTEMKSIASGILNFKWHIRNHFRPIFFSFEW